MVNKDGTRVVPKRIAKVRGLGASQQLQKSPSLSHPTEPPEHQQLIAISHQDDHQQPTTESSATNDDCLKTPKSRSLALSALLLLASFVILSLLGENRASHFLEIPATTRLRRPTQLWPFQNNNNKKSIWPSQESITGARLFVLNRKKDYTDKGAPTAHQWKLRGNGWLYTYQNITLLAELLTEDDAGREHSSSTGITTRGRKYIRIWNVHENASSNFNKCNLLTIWVRVLGPEIFAGAAKAVQLDGQSCFWEFEFNLQVPGSYEVDSKVLTWNGLASLEFVSTGPFPDGRPQGERSACLNTHLYTDITNNTEEFTGNNPHHFGFVGFKFYSPLISCCEICRRTPGCQYWETPPKKIGVNATFAFNGCELYYSSDTPPEEKRMSNLLATKDEVLARKSNRRRLVVHATGTPESNTSEVAYFLGCGWSFEFAMDFPCLSGDLDDHVYMADRRFVFREEGIASAAANGTTGINQVVPLCKLEDEYFSEKPKGRWVSENVTSQLNCPFPRKDDPNITEMFPITAFVSDFPHCWHRDDLSRPRARCSEVNCGKLDPSSKWDKSKLYQEKDWIGVWRNYHCSYLEFTDKQLQKCITKRKITSIDMKGASISAMLGQYSKLRLQTMKLYPEDSPEVNDAVKVVIDSLQWPHLLWHDNEQEWIEVLEKMPSINGSRVEHYWVSSFFASSEREPYVQVDRAKRLSDLAQDILTPKGYHMIDTFELSAAFSYDTAAQNDGLHIIGPPMKMAVTKVFHHMCAEVVNGSIV